VIAAAFAALSLSLPTPELPDLPPIKREAQITYVDRSGAVLGVRGGRYAPPVNLARLPPYVPAAFVAIEDRRFYEHTGFDARGIARAIVTNIERGRAAQGASTITQQLARNLYLSSERTLQRKTDELLYSIQLERTYSKQQILGLYLSRIYFGSGAYGVEAASQRYFNKPAARLTLREAAMLAAIPKSPVAYDPSDHPEASAERSRLVLDAMVETGAITAAQRTKALAERPKDWKAAPQDAAQYFLDWVDGETRRLVGAPKSDLVVETTLDAPLEAAAAQAAQAGVARYAKQGASQIAVVAIDGQGRVRALVGGASHEASPFNRATVARRQPGSAWKPFVYLTALEAGMTPDTPVVDQPLTIGTWSPRNYEDGFLGPITLQQALAQSVNTVAAGLADQVGRANVAATARRLGVASPIPTDPAMALGVAQVSPLEMAQAYAVLANGGQKVQAYGLERIRTNGGVVVWQRRAAAPVQLIGNPPLGELNQMLRAVVTSGTGARAQIPGRDVAGKTGTTSDYRDAWFCGFTGNLAAVVWMGRDDNSSMRRITGGSAPAEVWRGVMTTGIKRLPTSAIPPGPPAPAPAEPQPMLTPVIAAPVAPSEPVPVG
jgi:penicillin-binding protein 1A